MWQCRRAGIYPLNVVTFVHCVHELNGKSNAPVHPCVLVGTPSHSYFGAAVSVCVWGELELENGSLLACGSWLEAKRRWQPVYQPLEHRIVRLWYAKIPSGSHLTEMLGLIVRLSRVSLRAAPFPFRRANDASGHPDRALSPTAPRLELPPHCQSC